MNISLNKNALLLISLVVIGLAVVLTFVTQTHDPGYKPGIWPEADIAVNQADRLYQIEKEKGRDFSFGPCLSNALMDDWVVDLVHSPRMHVDDLPENQCSAYLEGRVKHFVELDLYGNVIRVK